MMFSGKFFISILLVSVVLVSGCTRQSPSEMFLESIDKANSIETVNLDYDIDMSLNTGGLTTKMKGTQTIHSYNNKMKILTELSTADKLITEKSEDYSIPEGEIICRETLLRGYVCQEIVQEFDFTQATASDPTEQSKLIKGWIEEGIATVSLAGKEKIIGRECNNFLIDLDVNEALENLTETYSLSTENAKLNVTQCMDEESGLPLAMEFVFFIEDFPLVGDFGINMKYKATALNFDVKESDVALPVPLEKVKWLPKFDITSAECSGNRVGVKVKATKEDLSAGTATLNLTSFSYDYDIGDLVEKGSIQQTSFGGAKKGEEKNLIFTFPEDLTEYSYDVKVKIGDSEAVWYCFTE